MKKIVDVKIEKEHYVAAACLVWCFDDRFTPALEAFVKEKGYARFDVIRVAGGSKSLASPENESDREFILKQIEISLRLHKAQRIVLMNHSDCGAYGGLKSFGGDEATEKVAHIAELGKAKEFLQKNINSDIPIDLIFVDCLVVWEI
ncbi:MAG: carbonic anhydrase [Patescibacteria group bacterium]